MPFGDKNIYFRFSVQFFSQFKVYHSIGNLKFNNLGIFQSLKLHILVEKVLPISLMLNFTPSTQGCYGLTWFISPEPCIGWSDCQSQSSGLNLFISYGTDFFSVEKSYKYLTN